jgi:hypothetical protein
MPEGFVCWSADGLEMIKSNVGDLGNDDNPILAALHEPMSVQARIPGTPPMYFGQDFGSEYSESDDKRILDGLNSTLSDPSQMGQNLLIAVKGLTGSGKSHFVRWLYQNVKKTENAKYVWVIRREDSKMQVIRKFVEDLEELGSTKANELKLQIDRSFRDVSEDKEKLVKELYFKVAMELNDNALLIEGKKDPEIRSLIIGSDDQNRKYLHNLLLSQIEAETSSMGNTGFVSIFRSVIDSFESEDATANSEKKAKVAEFSESITRSILRKYEGDGEQRFSELLTIAQSNLSIVTEILNDALDAAMSKVMHMDGAGFKEIFAELRKEMASLNQQLVIFMEDFSGVASSQNGLSKLQLDLLEVFTESASSERAPLRVIYAITDNTFQILASNVLQRHGLVVDINKAFDVTNASSFVSKYLNISRSNPELIRKAHREASVEQLLDSSWVPNACDTCKYRSQCHELFGKNSEGVGLYPLNNHVTERIFQKKPDEPRHIVGRTLQILLNSQSAIRDFAFPTKVALDSNLLLDDLDRAAMIERSFVQSAVDRSESDRKIRYVHAWGNGRIPNDEVSRIFRFMDLGALIEGDAIPTDTSTSGTDVVAPPPLEPRNTEIDRIRMWHAADTDSDAYNKLQNNLYQNLRSSISKSISDNFDSNFGNLKDYRDLGLSFGDKSISVQGFTESQEKNVLAPSYFVPRNEYGKSILLGAYVQHKGRNASEIPLSEEEISVAYACLGVFISQAVNDLIRRGKRIENSDQGPIGIAAKCIGFIKSTDIDNGVPSLTRTIADWLDSEGSASDNRLREIPGAIDLLFSDLNDLKKLVQSFVSSNGTYQIRKMIESMETQPSQVLVSLLQPQSDVFALPEASRPKWFKEVNSNLGGRIPRLLSPEFERDTRDLTISSVNYCSRQLQGEFNFTRQELAQLVNKVFNQANPGVLREDFIEGIDNSIKLFELWISAREDLTSIAKEDFKIDDYFSHICLIEEFNVLCSSLRMITNEFLKADEYVRASIRDKQGVALLNPANLEQLTTVNGVEHYVED